MRIAIIGATGNVGQRLTAEALGRGHEVVAISRNEARLAELQGVIPVQAEIADRDGLAEGLRGADAVIVSVRFQDNDIRPVFDAARAAGVDRIAVVGGAASLNNADGVRIIDQPGFPDAVKQEAGPAADALDWMRDEVHDLDWVFVSPSMVLAPGGRTGVFRIGGDEILYDENGHSRISYEDLAVAIIDELESPQHHRQRFTVGY